VALYGARPKIISHNCRQTTTTATSFHEANNNNNNNNNHRGDDDYLLPHIVGLFNTGTNAMKKLLLANFRQVQDNYWQHNATTKADDEQRLPYRRPVALENTVNSNVSNAYLDLDQHKHHPRDRLLQKLRADDENVKTITNDRLRIIMVRDPYRWIQSTCRNKYELEIRPILPQQQQQEDDTPIDTASNKVDLSSETTRQATRRHSARGSIVQRKAGARGCPNFDANKMEIHLYGQRYATLAQLWTQWYHGHVNITTANNETPLDDDSRFLVIRFEDLLFHTRDVVRSIQECSGMTLIPKTTTRTSPVPNHASTNNINDRNSSNTTTIHYVLERSKDHGGNALHRNMPVSRDFVNAISLYGTRTGRTRQFQPQTLRDTNQRDLDRNLLALFGYRLEEDIV